jgi:uncharacterized membrane protein YfcA
VTLLGALALFVVGVGASMFGSLVGMGGGFVIIPVLRIAFGVAPAVAAGTSLVMVLANTASATVGYLRDGRIDLRLAFPFALGAVPGSIAGALAVQRFTPQVFDIAYGCVLVVLAVLVMLRRSVDSRELHERTFAHVPLYGVACGVGIGFFSSLFGIGGGVVTIPLLLVAARMPPHVVTATTAFVVTATAPVGVLTHALGGDIDWPATVPLVLGGIVGGAIGPRLARRVSSPRLLTLVACAFIAAAIALALRHLL